MPWLVLGNVVDESSTRLARSGRSASEYEHGSFFIFLHTLFLWRNGTITFLMRTVVGQFALGSFSE